MNRTFQEYWQLTGDHRKSLPRESLEAQVGEAVDAMLDELFGDRDEWWLVGLDDGTGDARRPEQSQ